MIITTCRVIGPQKPLGLVTKSNQSQRKTLLIIYILCIDSLLTLYYWVLGESVHMSCLTCVCWSIFNGRIVLAVGWNTQIHYLHTVLCTIPLGHSVPIPHFGVSYLGNLWQWLSSTQDPLCPRLSLFLAKKDTIKKKLSYFAVKAPYKRPGDHMTRKANTLLETWKWQFLITFFLTSGYPDVMFPCILCF